MKPSKLFSLVSILIVVLAGSTSFVIQIPDSFFSKPAKGINGIKKDSLNIGLLIPYKGAMAAKHGAELAVREANEKGGYSGHPFHLIVRSTEGLWGTGSIESVNLIFKDHVLAIMGSLDGRNAHLAEQVATKTKVAFLSTWATDMTLSYAFVPWFFRCIPDDRQQAISLIHEIYTKRKLNNVAIINTSDYNSNQGVSTFMKIAKTMKIPTPKQYVYKLSDQNFGNTLRDIEKTGIEAIILFGKPPLASDIIPLLRQHNINQPVFGSLSLLDEQKALSHDWNILENVVIISSDQWFTKKGLAFQKEFQKVYNYQPGPIAAFAYDGINVIIEAVKKAGPDRDRIIDALSKIKHPGITGEIRFDEKGNRAGKVGLMILKNGIPLPLEEHQ